MGAHRNVKPTYERKYKCELCPTSFFENAHLKRHIKLVHSKTEEKHKCDLCDKILSTKGKKNLHQRNKHEEKLVELKCEICDKMFDSLKQLKDHQRIHEDLRKVECSICFRLLSIRSLVLHMNKVHSKPKISINRFMNKFGCEKINIHK